MEGRKTDTLIDNNSCADSTAEDVLLAKRRAYVLHKELQPIVLRKDGSLLRSMLPEKFEYNVCCKLSALQIKLYEACCNFIQGNPSIGVLSGWTMLTHILNHPWILAQKKKKTGSTSEDGGTDNLSWTGSLLEIEGPFLSSTAYLSDIDNPAHSGKVSVLMKILELCQLRGEKSLVFSQSIPTLGL